VQQKSVLAVDDNQRNLTILRHILAKEFRFSTATSGEEAIRSASELRPDLILLDIMMPGLDGYEVCRRLKADPNLQHTPVIMVSAKAMLEERLQGYEAGAADYLTKPFEEDELLAKVRVHLRLKSMEEVDRLKSDFLKLLSHETRTPLNGVVGPAQVLAAADAMDLAERQEWAQLILVSAARLQDLLEKVLTLAEIKSGDARSQRQLVSFADLVREAVGAAAARAEEGGVSIEPRLESGPLVRVDVEHLRFVVAAMLDNAIRFSPPGKAVVVETAAEGNRCVLRVTDRGEGISADFLPRVFDEFTCRDVKHHTRGAGLSLAIGRSVVAAHGGTIGVESRPGEITTFTLALPSQSEPGERPRSYESADAGSAVKSIQGGEP
jgi:two-component system, sensor histidine kinase and response regulator